MTKECYVLAYVHRTKGGERVYEYKKNRFDGTGQRAEVTRQCALEEAVIAGKITHNEARTAYVDVVQDGDY